MKKAVVAIALALSVFNAQADCISKANSSLKTLGKVYNSMNSVPGFVTAAVLNAGGPLVIGLFGTAFQYTEIYNMRALLKDAEANGGKYLDDLADEIKDSRPDLAGDKNKLAQILKEANQKETVCGNGFITGVLLRTLIMGGDVEAANAENHKISVSDFNNKIDG